MSGGNNLTRMEIYSPVQYGTNTAFSSRTQEKMELQQLNDRLVAYVQHVRLLAEKRNQVDSSAILKSTKAMETEMFNLKEIYEQELDKLRKELENCNHERATHQVQCKKHMQCASELQDRLNVETDKNSRLHEEMNNYQCRISSLEAEVKSLRAAATRPHPEIEQLQRHVASLTRELEACKRRYEHEQVARQEVESRIQQLMHKAQFNEKINHERIGELTSRLELSAATILSLEAKLRETSKPETSVMEVLKQVREAAEDELKKYQTESEEQYNKNLTALKVQLDSNAKIKVNLESEKIQLQGNIGELQARIRTLEAQVSSQEHQKQTLEEALTAERSRAAESVRNLEQRVREVQDLLVVKMREVTSARELNVPLKAEIEALKALLEDEEKRLRMAAAGVQGDGTSKMPNYNAAGYTMTNNAISSTNTANYNSANYNSVSNTSTSLPFQGSYDPTSGASTSPLPHYPYPAHSTMPFREDHSRPYVPSPPLSVTYIPEALHPTGTSVDPMFIYPQYKGELDPQLFGYSSCLPHAKYTSENIPKLNHVVEPSPPATPHATGASRAKSAPAERQQNLNLIRSDQGQGHDYFDKMFHDLQQDTLYSQGRPHSSQKDRPSSSSYHDYAVTTSSSRGVAKPQTLVEKSAKASQRRAEKNGATGDMKIAEVHHEGKYIRLVNEGNQELEFGGFMIQQNVGGHPVAVFRFPPRTKFPPSTTITVYAACNDRRLHHPPLNYVWKEQQKWGAGPECTTILCKPNGQAVAWTTAAHRFTRDTFQDDGKEADKSENSAVTVVEEKSWEDIADDDNTADGNVTSNTNGNKVNHPISLRREKQQPPSLQTSTGVCVSSSTQARDSACPDKLPAQKGGGSSQRKYVSGISSYQHSAVRGNGKSAALVLSASE